MSKFVILHKKKDTLNRLCCIMKVTKQTLQHLRKKVPLANTIHHSTFIYNQFKKLNLCKSFSVTVHSVHSNVAKIHSRLPAAMEFWLVCLGILAYSCQNTSRDSGV